MNTRIPTSEINWVVTLWLFNAICGPIGFMLIPYIVIYLKYFSLVYLVFALLFLGIALRGTVKVLERRIPGLQGRTGARLGWCLYLIMAGVTILLTVLFIRSETYKTDPIANGEGLIWLIILILSLPVYGLVISLAIRRLSYPLPKKDLVLLPALFLLAELAALVVCIPLGFLMIVGAGFMADGMSTTEANILLTTYLIALIQCYFGIGGALGSILMFRRFNLLLFTQSPPIPTPPG